ncbi:MAG: hypothetical protein IKO19_02245 [Candidatus Riflebacteria bacterium]|nr:hypothetical protein [Candidatus Riflebacteria bacterium]MBR4569478.1 hypothetical protein [Candidatus Riflebacteria bacterium]
MAKEYLPVFAEEIFIVNLYGTDEEIYEFNELMKETQVEKNLMSMTLIIEEIKRRNFLKIDWQCCSRCRYYANCKINWYRGERHMNNRHCCTYCQNFWDCHSKFCKENNLNEKTAEICKQKHAQ